MYLLFRKIRIDRERLKKIKKKKEKEKPRNDLLSAPRKTTSVLGKALASHRHVSYKQ